MRNSNSAPLVAACMVLACCACASAPSAPGDWLSDAEKVPEDPRGAWVTVRYESNGIEARLDGELLAIDSLDAWVAVDDVARQVPLDAVIKLRLDVYDSHPGAAAGLTFLGMLSTISNGWILGLTAPTWLLVGSVATANRSRDPIIAGEPGKWREFVPYARFPQGLPAEFSDGALLAQAPAGLELPPPGESPTESVAPVPPAVTRKFWFTAGAGPGFHNDYTGIAFVGGVGVGAGGITLGTRVAMVQRDSAGYELDIDSGETFDLALLVGLQDQHKGVQAAVAVGPAAWATRFGDLGDIDLSFAAQVQVLRYWEGGIGIGLIVAYNANDFRDFFMFSLAIAYGSP